MATFSNDSVKIAQKAQSAATLEPMSSFEDTDSLVATVSSELYEEFVQGLLVEEPWTFAKAQTELDHLDETPIGRWSDAWQLPRDPAVLSIRAITVNDSLIRFDRYNDKIYCNYDENSTLVMDYIYRCPESLWPPDFKMYAILSFGALLAASITRNQEIVASLTEMADRSKITAIKNYSQGRTASKVNTKRLINRRR